MGWLLLSWLQIFALLIPPVVVVMAIALRHLAAERSQLRKVDEKLRLMGAAVEEARELILIVAVDGRLRHANRAFCAAMGYELGELLDKPPSALIAEESAASFDAIAKTAKGRAWSGTLVHTRRDGTSFQAATSVVPLVDDQGRTTDYVWMERDITEELKLRSQLIHSERLSAVGQLVSGVAHELNNPLQSILGFTELLIDAEERPDLRRDLEQVRSEAIRAGKIVRNLLAFVRRSSSERSAANANDIVRTTIALRSYEFATANIRLFENYADPLPPVVVNPEEIQQVILNLIMNAEQAMRATRKSGTLTVTTECTANMVTIDIRDTGPGVPAELAGRVFEPFFSTKEVGEGTGLGLSIAMGIAEAHGGSLVLMPTDSGAWFRLSLPAAVETDQAPSLLASAAAR